MMGQQATVHIHQRQHRQWYALMHISQQRRLEIIKCTSLRKLKALNC